MNLREIVEVAGEGLSLSLMAVSLGMIVIIGLLITGNLP